MSKSIFVKEFTDWPRDFYEGAFDLLKPLTVHYTLAIFPNITAVHWGKYYPILHCSGLFKHLFASYQLGLAKPDVLSFSQVAKQLGHAPYEILFLDDNVLNVEGARAVGINAEHAVGLKGVQRVFLEWKIV